MNFKKPIYAIREDSNDSNTDTSGNEGKQKQLWCICRSEDGARFMICCDCCEEWYHGDCVNVTPKQSDLISKYYCAKCQKRNPTLKIHYKAGAIKPKKEPQIPSKVDKAFKVKREGRLFEPVSSKSEKQSKGKSDEKPSHSKLDKSYNPSKKIHEPQQSKFEKIYQVKSEEKFHEQSISRFEKPFKPKSEAFESPTQSKFDKSFKNKHENKFVEPPQSRFEKSFKPKPDERQVDYKVEKMSKLKSDDRHYDLMQSKYEKSTKTRPDDRLVDNILKDVPSTFKIDKPIKPGTCGECLGCLRKVDCTVCLHCKTKSDKGCLKRMCQNPRDKNIDKQVKAEKKMLTMLPGEFIPTKAVVPKKPVIRQPNFNKTGPPSSSSPSSNENISKPLKRPLSPSNSSDSSSIVSNKPVANTNTLNKLPAKKLKLEPESTPQKPPKPKVVESSNSSDENLEEDDEENEINDVDMDEESDVTNESDEETSGSFVSVKVSKPNIKITQRPIKKKILKPKYERNEIRSISPCAKPKFPRKSSRPNISDPIKQYKPTECYNIGCNKSSRLGSKYCSDECGIQLAEQRLVKYLPSRVANWNRSDSICYQKERRSQADIQEECETIHHNLRMLDKSNHKMIEFIDRKRSSCSATNTTDDEERRIPGVNDDSVQCVTCGMMVTSTKALIHMENCFQKIEGGTMVFADFEEQPIGSKLFCDFYDNNIRGYCKRLAALCDHNKDSQVDPKTICAFSLSYEKSSKVCMAAKTKCNRHVNWERIQRAVIDMNRYRLLVRYEELQNEDRKLKHNIDQRGGVMALMLHETIDHQPMKPLLPIRNIDKNKMRKFTEAQCI